MHKFFDGKNKAWKKALYAFLVGASLIFLLFAIIKFPSISSYVGGVVKAMAAFIYGFVLAFICNPIYKRLHKYVFRFVDIRKPHPQIRNLLSIITTYLIFGVIIAIVVRAVIPEILENWEELVGNILTALPEGVSEIMTHPGLNKQELDKHFTWNYHWEDELGAFLSVKNKNLLEQRKIALINFGGLK